MRFYNTFSLEELLQDEAFRRWVTEQNPEDEAFWQKWLLKYPQKQATVEQARAVILSIHGMQHAEITKEEVQHSIRQTEKAKGQGSKWIQFPMAAIFGSKWLRMAASITLLMSISWWLSSNSNQGVVATSNQRAKLPTSTSQSLLVKVNHSEKPMLINLSDGSTVLLQKEGRVSYPRTFTGAGREIRLTGEAFFEIQKNPKVPFYVHTREVITKVMGTSFYVKADSANQRLMVYVKTGKVSVYATPATGTLARRLAAAPDAILNPNQQVVYEAEKTKTVQTTPVFANIPIPNTHFEFNSTPVPQVFDALEKVYGVTIHFDKASYKIALLRLASRMSLSRPSWT